MNHTFVIHSSASGHLGWFYFLAIMNTAVMDMVVKAPRSTYKVLYVYTQK